MNQMQKSLAVDGARMKAFFSKLQTVTLFWHQVSSVQLVTDNKLERPDRFKQRHRLQFAKCIAGLLYYGKRISISDVKTLEKIKIFMLVLLV